MLVESAVKSVVRLLGNSWRKLLFTGKDKRREVLNRKTAGHPCMCSQGEMDLIRKCVTAGTGSFAASY